MCAGRPVASVLSRCSAWWSCKPEAACASTRGGGGEGGSDGGDGEGGGCDGGGSSDGGGGSEGAGSGGGGDGAVMTVKMRAGEDICVTLTPREVDAASGLSVASNSAAVRTVAISSSVRSDTVAVI
eukprot:4667842-Prymnesium_polylepis.3